MEINEAVDRQLEDRQEFVDSLIKAQSGKLTELEVEVMKSLRQNEFFSKNVGQDSA